MTGTILEVSANAAPSGNRTFSRRIIRDGIAGNYDVIFEMIRLTRDAVSYDKGVEKLAKDLIKSSGLTSYDPVAIYKVLFDFVKASITYIDDPAGRVESLKSARITLSDGWGDCDDEAVLNATLLGVLGFEDVRFAMARYSDAASFEHVYAVAYINVKGQSQRFVFDTTLPNGQLNEEVPGVEIKEIPIFSEVKGLDGVSGVINNARHTVKKVGKTVVKILPTAAGYVPAGFLAGGALATGATLITQSVGDTASLSETASQINRQLDEIILALCEEKIAHDLAKSYALQLASQLGAVERKPDDAYTRQVVKTSIQNKLDFIRDFPTYAKANGIKVVHLNSTLMLIAGLGLVGSISGIAAYKYWQLRKLNVN